NKDLFDWEEGIMNYGASSTANPFFHVDWWYRPANFANRGSNSERKVFFQFFEEGKLLFEQACKMKISGNTTRYFPQKSMKIYPVEPKVEDKMAYPFWGEFGNEKSESLLLRNGGNDNMKTLFAD